MMRITVYLTFASFSPWSGHNHHFDYSAFTIRYPCVSMPLASRSYWMVDMGFLTCVSDHSSVCCAHKCKTSTNMSRNWNLAAWMTVQPVNHLDTNSCLKRDSFKENDMYTAVGVNFFFSFSIFFQCYVAAWYLCFSCTSASLFSDDNLKNVPIHKWYVIYVIAYSFV